MRSTSRKFGQSACAGARLICSREVEEDLRSHQQIATENGLEPQTCEKRSQGRRRCGGSDINRARAAAEVDRDEVQIAFKSANGRMKIVMTTDDGRVRK